MEFKGTKGEWDWEENSASQVDDSTCIEVRSGGGPQIAYLQSFVGWGSDHERNATIANANLIAAAPDLLEALQEVTGSLGVMVMDADSCPEILKARAAISKALGEE
ncbi:hypothetical protein INP82_22720 [Citrobacter sedlakii]|uniref:hypothetical protein n=1 Tax=Citrobacter TaxID=544 RepID=UPI001969F845|nr:MULTISPECIES: hypothetical protein [Citrobacter]MBM9570199.1 hypothetical protein [Citrobacter sedlakii]HBL4693687.1 hypothetical protein [Citrobacter sedlakii]HBL4708126.1 hypothetical protein [Citrobacter sedlakii]HBL4722226.1 hypothetical protein [Citrobacter sedlakii]HCA7843173.1 hypothetical protein [Citrobacter sedlakii]